MVRRCLNTDMSQCQNNPRNPCCGQYMTDRFFPIGPNIQPTLTENWVSALFEFGGRDPVGFSTVVTIFLTLVIGALVSAWGLLGFYLGKFKIECLLCISWGYLLFRPEFWKHCWMLNCRGQYVVLFFKNVTGKISNYSNVRHIMWAEFWSWKQLTFPLLICTWILKNQVGKLMFDKMDF